ncbi:MAG: vWA domain-containing protein [Patescibacteria group bacterium]
MSRNFRNTNGSITLIMVFITSTVLFLLIFADHVNAMRESVMARQSASTEQAFYSAQSCLEEGYLKLRTDADFSGGSITLDGSTCTVTPEHDPGSADGKLVSTGAFDKNIRTVSSFYTDAGASETRTPSAIYHILDRTGSMANGGTYCTLSEYPSYSTCLAHHGAWGPQPYTLAKEAAKSFIDFMDPASDAIGVISYNIVQSVDFIASNDFTAAKLAIDALPAPADYTNIGDALGMATQQLDGVEAESARVEILLTDGRANRPVEATAEQYALEKAASAKSKGIIIFTIGLGATVNEPFLRDVATSVDGAPLYFHAPTGADLASVYNQIANVIISYNIGQQSWREE